MTSYWFELLLAVALIWYWRKEIDNAFKILMMWIKFELTYWMIRKSIRKDEKDWR